MKIEIEKCGTAAFADLKEGDICYIGDDNFLMKITPIETIEMDVYTTIKTIYNAIILSHSAPVYVSDLTLVNIPREATLNIVK